MLQAGQVLKSNGVDGELVVSFRDIDPEDIKATEPVFIYFDGLPVPFFIKSLTRRGNTKALVHFVDIESIEDAEELVGKGIFLGDDSLGEDQWEEGDFSFLVGWTLFGADDEEVGEITDFLDIPSNPCLEVETKNGAAIVPLHEDLIIAVNEDSGQLTLRIPEGLLP